MAAAQSPARPQQGLLGAPAVPDAPGLGAQIASRISNSLSQNKGRMIGGLLGNVVGGPVGGLLGGYVGNRIQQSNTPQMSAAARDAINAGTFDGFSHGPARQSQGLLGGLFGPGGLLGPSLGQPSIPGRPTGLAAYTGGSGGPSMSSEARSAMGVGGFDGFSHDGGGNKNTSSKSGSSKSGGGKKK
ncbi:MAG: hypothetical protein EOP20_00850 [Hyphomicrobiales bacterium]|nr:MAG: hypothetical protein EOP20_00850 [Hyphomicrobiales bacterium]